MVMLVFKVATEEVVNEALVDDLLLVEINFTVHTHTRTHTNARTHARKLAS